MEFQFRLRPWAERPISSPDVFLSNVRNDIERVGYWETSAEFRMGAGPTCRVTPSAEDDGSFDAVATWGALQMSGRYSDLEHALLGLEKYGDALMAVREKGAWRGLVE